MNLKAGRTEKNLLAALCRGIPAQEPLHLLCQPPQRDEGFEQICAIFIETADNEKEHARYSQHRQAARCGITAKYPAGVIGRQWITCLLLLQGEKLEWGTLYPGFAKILRRDIGFREGRGIVY